MIYCFSDDLITDVGVNNEFLIQANYAKKIGCFARFNPANGQFLDEYDRPMDVDGKQLFLRVPSKQQRDAIQAAREHGGILIETQKDIAAVRTWYRQIPLKRYLCAFANKEALQAALHSDSKLRHSMNKPFFIKTSEKGTSMIVALHDLYEESFWQDKGRCLCVGDNGGIILSEVIKICRDDLGKCEARFFVRDGKICNGSRCIHSLVHQVEHAYYDAATLFVERIRQTTGFPKSYVLDIAKLHEDSQEGFDIIELNSLTSSMCYINNSIFDEPLLHLQTIHQSLHFGFEYCLDYWEHPQRYRHHAIAGESYEYVRG